MRDIGRLFHGEWTDEGPCQVIRTDKQSHARARSDGKFEEEKGWKSREISRDLGDSGVKHRIAVAWCGVAWA
jgi:hypothetical protein